MISLSSDHCPCGLRKGEAFCMRGIYLPFPVAMPKEQHRKVAARDFDAGVTRLLATIANHPYDPDRGYTSRK